jgi:hypothetical protein
MPADAGQQLAELPKRSTGLSHMAERAIGDRDGRPVRRQTWPKSKQQMV